VYKKGNPCYRELYMIRLTSYFFHTNNDTFLSCQSLLLKIAKYDAIYKCHFLQTEPAMSYISQVGNKLLICISNQAFLVCFKYINAYKCHIINFLLTLKYQTSVFLHKPDLWAYKKDFGPIFLFTDLVFG
jgi:hypothetical protein